jgi:SAM-dependent methyltransferase
MQRAIGDWKRGVPGDSLQAVLLGVTPEIAGMDWPEGTDLLAMDESEEMIRIVWPGDVPGGRKVLCADWLRLPVADNSIDVMIGDGSFSCVNLEYPRGHQLLTQSARKALRKHGILIIRIYARPESCDPPEVVFRDLEAGRFETFDAFRLRLLMAVQGDRPWIKLDDVYRAWQGANLDVDRIWAGTGWRMEVLHSLLRYQGKEAHYSFPTLQEFRDVLAAEFEEAAIHFPGYQLGERCPILVLQPRGSRVAVL